MRILVLLLSLVVGLAAGVAAIAVHRSMAGLALAMVATLAVMWTLRLWLRFGSSFFAAGWLVPLAVAISGRAEGDYAVSADLLGTGLIVCGLVVLVLGLTWSRPVHVPHDSGSRAGSA